MEPITFGNVEAEVCAYLTPLLTIPILRVIPSDRPASFVRVLLTGTSRTGIAQADARVTLECWAANPNGDGKAHDLARQVYGLMCAMDLPDAHVPEGADGWAGGPYVSPDPDSGTPRYVMTAIVRQSAVLEA